MPVTSDPTFILLHSPLVGPTSWAAVCDELHLRGYRVAAPAITSDAKPYWRAYADDAVEAITDLGADAIVLVAHSAAGPLVAAVADMAVPEVAAVIFVDAPLPRDGRSRLDEMEATAPSFAARIRADLKAGECYPAWDDAFLSALVPDEDQREAFLGETAARPLAFFEEPIPAPAWPRDRCAYLQLSETYSGAADEAERFGWPLERHPLGHFATMTHPDVIASGILALFKAVND